LLLCNDKAVLGSWVNGRWTNLFTGSVIAALVMLSVVVTASVLFPSITGGHTSWPGSADRRHACVDDCAAGLSAGGRDGGRARAWRLARRTVAVAPSFAWPNDSGADAGGDTGLDRTDTVLPARLHLASSDAEMPNALLSLCDGARVAGSTVAELIPTARNVDPCHP
jgi:hypothetical protein